MKVPTLRNLSANLPENVCVGGGVDALRETHHPRGFPARKVYPEPNDTETIRQIATEACKNQRPVQGGKDKGLAPRKEMTATG